MIRRRERTFDHMRWMICGEMAERVCLHGACVVVMWECFLKRACHADSDRSGHPVS